MVRYGTLNSWLVLLSLLAVCVCVLGHGVVLTPLGQTNLLGTQRDIARTTAINTKLPRRLAAGAGGTLRWVEAETTHGARRLHQAEEEEEEEEEDQREPRMHQRCCYTPSRPMSPPHKFIQASFSHLDARP